MSSITFTGPAVLYVIETTLLAEFESHSLRHTYSEAPCFSCCEAIYACVAGLALKMPLKLSRYCRKTSTHSTEATSAGAMLDGAIVR